jgi:acyl carrier protein
MTLETVTDLVLRTVRDVAAREGLAVPLHLDPATPLFGEQGSFDSLGLVSLILAVEEILQDEYGASVSLADERAMSQKNSPFRSVGALAEYTFSLLEGPVARAG